MPQQQLLVIVFKKLMAEEEKTRKEGIRLPTNRSEEPPSVEILINFFYVATGLLSSIETKYIIWYYRATWFLPNDNKFYWVIVLYNNVIKFRNKKWY